MNFLSIFVLIPLLMLFALWLSRSIAQIRTVMVVGSSALLISAIALTVGYLQAPVETPPRCFSGPTQSGMHPFT